MPWSTKGEPGEYVKGIWGEVQGKLPKLRLRVHQIAEEGDKEVKIATAQSREVRDKAYYYIILTPLKKKASFPVMSPVSSITTNTHILAVDSKFSFAVSLKSWVAILFPSGVKHGGKCVTKGPGFSHV